MTIQVRTGSRLHFGLIAPAASSGRRFGGAGLMVQAPGVEIRLERSDHWCIGGLLAEHGAEVLRRLASSYLLAEANPHRLTIIHAPLPHTGLGTGTQLALAIARGVAEASGFTNKPAVESAQIVGRGARSAIGIHGFEHGGFLVDGGKREDDAVAPLVSSLTFPEAWRVVLFLPQHAPGVHGAIEKRAFQDLQEMPGRAEALCRRVLLDLLPALSAEDFAGFSESLYWFNREAGEAFRAVQGGPYSSARIEELVEHLRRLGIRGVGQTSWGPTVFAVAADQEQAEWTVQSCRGLLPSLAQPVIITGALNQGCHYTHHSSLIPDS